MSERCHPSWEKTLTPTVSEKAKKIQHFILAVCVLVRVFFVPLANFLINMALVWLVYFMHPEP